MDAKDLSALPEDAFVNRDTASKLAGNQSRWTLTRWSADGKFPKPVVIGGAVLYRVRELRAWLADPLAWATQNNPQTESLV